MECYGGKQMLSSDLLHTEMISVGEAGGFGRETELDTGACGGLSQLMEGLPAQRE